MRRLVRSKGYARVRFALGFLYIGFGALIIAQMLHGVGPRFEAVPGLVLGAAMIGLGALRVRAGWPTESAR
jgi:hypothetical protein